ncbi:hypothetical protein F4810DRAFT_264389 [Camillea tinctor]|nr:hypothetical protein F4810DRAFT_264389 [Camillea tinctor]
MRIYGIAALNFAAWSNCVEICRLLTQRGISPNQSYNHSIYLSYALLRKMKSPRSILFYSKFSTTPLIEAAVQNSIESLKVLLEDGADVNHRCVGVSALGQVLIDSRNSDFNRAHRVETVKILVQAGADVMEPLWESSDAEPMESDETILDVAYLSDDKEIYDIISASNLAVPSALLSVSGIISNPRKGLQALQEYNATTRFPCGRRRRRIRDLSIYRSLQDPIALANMLHAGFDITIPHILEMMKRKLSIDVPNYAWLRDSTKSKPSHEQVLQGVLEKIPISDLSPSAIKIILEKEDSTRNILVQTCIDSNNLDDLRSLLGSGFNFSEGEGVALLAEAAQQSQLKQVELLQEFGVGTHGYLKTSEGEFSAISASLAGIQGDGSTCTHLPRTGKPASVKMLDFLICQGADIQSCQSIFRSQNLMVTPDQVIWLIINGFDFHDQSIWSILQHTSNDMNNHEEMIASLMQAGLPILSPREIRNSKAPISEENPLSCFIKFSSNLQLVQEVIESGIKINGNDIYPSGDTPLQAAVRKGDLLLVKYIVEHGAKLNSRDVPLREACRLGTSEGLNIAKYLLEKGANVDRKIDETQISIKLCTKICSPLQTALTSDFIHIPLIELLVHYGADVNIPMRFEDEEKKLRASTALHLVLSACCHDTDKLRLAQNSNALEPWSRCQQKRVSRFRWIILYPIGAFFRVQIQRLSRISQRGRRFLY